MNTANPLRLAMLGVVALLLGGCAFGQKITYSNTTADIEAKGDKTVAVATHDQRPYVVDADKSPSFVGLSRGGYGNPFDVETPSGAPLSDEISESVSRSLAERGFRSSIVKVTPAQSRHVVLEALQAGGAERLVLITLKEWKTDKYMRTSMIEDVSVKVFGTDGKELASATFTGDDTIGDVQAAFRSKIERWFAEPRIVDALK